jgi:hypothetical protein
MFNAELLNKSATKGDVIDYNGGGVVYFGFPQYGWQTSGALPPDLLPYWSQERDFILRSTVLNESLWGSAVRIAASKIASKSWDIDGNVKAKVERAQEMMLALDNKGWVPGTYKGIRDYLTTDNGEHWEIVRQSNAAGSRILGLVHLDSLRCVHTGDPETPVLYRDLKGRYHELKDYQVIHLCDMPSPGAEWFDVGICAASSAYKHIYKNYTIDQYFNDKVSGNKPKAIHFVTNVSKKNLESALITADAKTDQNGAVMYKGVIVIPMIGEAQPAVTSIPIAEIPDGFDAEKERDYSIVIYADAIGLDPQELKALSGQGLNGGQQSVILYEAAKGKGLAAREKDWIHQINEKVNPTAVTFTFTSRDLTDEKKEADNAKVRAETRKTQMDSGEITPLESRQLAVDQNDLPPEFIQDDETAGDQLGDTEKPLVDSEIEPLPEAEQEAVATTVPGTPKPGVPNPNVKTKGVEAGYELYQRMRESVE